METYLPLIKSLIADWVQLTIDNPLYAGALVIAVWLLTASLYSIIIASLKKKIIASENARIDMENQLNAAQQHSQQMQAELTANTEQMQQDRLWAQNESQRAAGLEEQLTQRNKQVAAIIQSLATSIDLGERPVPITEDIKAEGLWQQHDRVITLLTTRLRNEQQAKTELQQAYQAETAKRTENEAVIATLQAGLAAQTVQVANLEQALEAQKVLQQQQQDQAQQILAQTLEKHLTELARLTELEQQALTLVNAKQQLTQLQEKLTAKDALISQLENIKPAEPVKAPAPAALKTPEITETVIEITPTAEVIPPAAIEPQPETPAKGQLGKLKSMFGKTKPAPVLEEPEAIEIKEETAEIQPEPVAAEQAPASAAESPRGKIKHFFGKAKQPEAEKQETVEIQPEPLAIEQAPVSPAQGQIGKLKKLLGKTKKAPVIAETKAAEIKPETAELKPEPLAVEQPPASAAKGQLGKLKGIFGSKQPAEAAAQEAADIQFEPLEIEHPPVAPAKGRLGKIKHYFGEPKPAEEPQPEVEIQPEPVIEPAKVNAAKGQLGKLKNLFGKKQ